MNCLIIGAMVKGQDLLNKYRHDMLGRFLDRYCSYDVDLVTGNDGDFEESAFMLNDFDDPAATVLWDFLNLARVFDQEYILIVQNDEAFSVCCETAYKEKLGVWWPTADPSCPETVHEAVSAGRYTVNQVTGEIFGIQTPAMAEKWAQRVARQAFDDAANASSDLGYALHSPERLERDAHLARTYPY